MKLNAQCAGPVGKWSASGPAFVGYHPDWHCVDDEFVLSLDGVANQPVQLLLTDIMSHTILDQTEQVLSNHHEIRLWLGGRPTGVYILTVISPQRVLSLRLLKR